MADTPIMMDTSFADMGWADNLPTSGWGPEPASINSNKKKRPKKMHKSLPVAEPGKGNKGLAMVRNETSNIVGAKRKDEHEVTVQSFGKKKDSHEKGKSAGKVADKPNKHAELHASVGANSVKRMCAPQEEGDGMAKKRKTSKPAGHLGSKPSAAQLSAVAAPLAAKPTPQSVGTDHGRKQGGGEMAHLSKRAQKRLAKDAAAGRTFLGRPGEAGQPQKGSQGDGVMTKFDVHRATTPSQQAQQPVGQQNNNPGRGSLARKGPDGNVAAVLSVPLPTPLVGKKKAKKGPTVLEQMKAQLAGGRFRWINEVLYTHTGDEALAMMLADASTFDHYHAGYQRQMDSWPVLPVDEIAHWLRSRSPDLVVADFGCGDARLMAAVPNTVHSLDLVAHMPGVIACNMAHTPLVDGSVDVAVFCLSLMGTDYGAFLVEARRVLKPKGWLLVAEVRSRFEDADGEASLLAPFLAALKALGFKLRRKDASNKMFMLLELQLLGKPEVDSNELDWPQLKPCIYKRR